MIEIVKNSYYKVPIYVIKGDEAVEPDEIPTYEIFDADTEVSLKAGAAIHETTDVGYYSIPIDQSITSVDRNLRVDWQYDVDGITIYGSEFTLVSTPYAEIGEIIAELGLGAEPQDPNYFPYNKLRTAERLARMQINNYTGRVFGLKEGTQVTHGFGSDTIIFPERMTSFYKLEQDDTVIYDSTANYNALGFELELTDTSQGIRIRANQQNDVSVMPPSPFYSTSKLNFLEGSRYKVYGTMGYKYVPIEVKQAAFLLINDHLFNDSLWRERYIDSFDTGAMSVKLRDSAFTGTGNLIADDLLDTYKITGIVVI